MESSKDTDLAACYLAAKLSKKPVPEGH